MEGKREEDGKLERMAVKKASNCELVLMPNTALNHKGSSWEEMWTFIKGGPLESDFSNMLEGMTMTVAEMIIRSLPYDILRIYRNSKGEAERRAHQEIVNALAHPAYSVLRCMSETQVEKVQENVLKLGRYGTIRARTAPPTNNFGIGEKAKSRAICSFDSDLDKAWERISNRTNLLRNTDRPKCKHGVGWATYRNNAETSLKNVIRKMTNGEQLEDSPTVARAIKDVFLEMDFLLTSAFYKFAGQLPNQSAETAIKAVLRRYEDGAAHLSLGFILMVSGDIRGKT